MCRYSHKYSNFLTTQNLTHNILHLHCYCQQKEGQNITNKKKPNEEHGNKMPINLFMGKW
jgi:hypothetical protein